MPVPPFALILVLLVSVPTVVRGKALDWSLIPVWLRYLIFLVFLRTFLFAQLLSWRALYFLIPPVCFFP